MGRGLLAWHLSGALRRYANCAALGSAAGSTAAGGAVEQVEDDLLVAALIQVEGDLLGTLVLLVGYADGDLLGTVSRVAYADRDLLPRGDVAEIQDDFRATG